MVTDHNPDTTESKPLNTEIETLAPETAEEHSSTPESTLTHETAPRLRSRRLARNRPLPLRLHRDDRRAGYPTRRPATRTTTTPTSPQPSPTSTASRPSNPRRPHNLTQEEVVVTGTLVKITDKHAIIDIGLKSEGLLALDQITNPDGTHKFAAGDSIEVVVEREETHGGGYIVSHEKALRHKVWDKLEEAANTKTPVKGMVVSRVKGGLTVDIGIKAFLPGSQIEVRPVRNLDGYVGTEIEVRVIKLNKKRGNVVISRKELLEEDQNAKKAVTLSTLEEGTVLTGTVKNLTDYGAFVDLGGLDGLLHITDMSWGRLTHPRDLVNVGDEIQVKVLKFDKDKQRVSLGFKQLTPDPWLDATERYPIGAQVRGRVLSVTDYGAFVELEQGIEGLVHVSEMTWSKRMKHPSKMVKPGDEVDTIILSVNPNDRRISLGMKQLQDNPWERSRTSTPPVPSSKDASATSPISAPSSRSKTASTASSTSRTCPGPSASSTPPKSSRRVKRSAPSSSASNPKTAVCPSASSSSSPTSGIPSSPSTASATSSRARSCAPRSSAPLSKSPKVSKASATSPRRSTRPASR